MLYCDSNDFCETLICKYFQLCGYNVTKKSRFYRRQRFDLTHKNTVLQFHWKFHRMVCKISLKNKQTMKFSFNKI